MTIKRRKATTTKAYRKGWKENNGWWNIAAKQEKETGKKGKAQKADTSHENSHNA